MTRTAALSAAEELRFRLRGGLYEPGDPEYADACTLYNAMIERRPRYVATCAAPEDVVAALAFARGQGLPIAVRGGGHSVAGLSLVDDGVVLDVRSMRDVEVDTDRRVVRVGGGATWADVDPVTVAAGFATTGGRVSTTGVAGLTMGGGSGWLERKHGLACDNLVAAELVLADGEIVRTTESERPELLWALRGGGGNFGVVTALELRVHPIPELILGGMLMWPLDRGLEVLERFRDVMDGAPDGLSLAAMYFTCPDEDGFPADLRGEAVLAVLGGHAGPVAEAESLFAPLRELGPAADMVEPMPYDVLNRSFDDPPGFRNYWTAEQLPEPPDDAALAAIHGLATRLPHPAAQLFIVVWGGQVARAQPGSSPLAARDTAWTVHPLILWDDPVDDAAMVAYARGYREVLAPWSSGEVYLNFVGEEGAERTAAGYAAEARERIAAIKASYDPDEVFRTHQTL